MGNSILLLFIIGFNSFYANMSMRGIGSELSNIAENNIPLAETITLITEHQLEQIIHVERILRLANSNKTESRITDEIRKFDALSKKINEEIEDALFITRRNTKLTDSREELAKFNRIGEKLARINKEHLSFERHSHHVFDLIKAGEFQAIDDLIEEIEQEEDNLNHELVDLLADIDKFTKKSVLVATEHEHQAEFVATIVGIVSIMLGLCTSFLVSRRIIADIKSATVVASGNLGDPIVVKTHDEIGELLDATNGMRTKLLNMFKEISGTTEQLSTASEEISIITQETSQNIQQQQSETELIATAMNEMNTTVIEVSSNVANTAEAAKHANIETEKGLKVVRDAVKGIQDLANKMECTSEVITKVEQDSQNINTVLDVIKGIADQTNLLALNAAIEAARAGEQGRGFAVVADEVRTLAGRTQESTTEINDIIEKLQERSRSAAEAMQDSQEHSALVVETAELASVSLSAISSAVSKIDEMSSQIASSAEEQISVSNEMNKNIIHIKDMADSNAEGAVQTSQASNELASMASNLQRLVNQFKL